MNDESNRNKLILPLSPVLLNYIKHEYPDIGTIIVSTIELTIKESKNHYHDVMRSLEPLLHEKTKSFVDKLFMFRRKLCREGANCTSKFCLFAHDESELVISKRSASETSFSKKPRVDNNEVVFNRVDESKYSIDDLTSYAKIFGSVVSMRRLNKGKYLVIFNTPEEALKLVESQEYVFGDSDIKKFFNIKPPHISADTPAYSSSNTRSSGYSQSQLYSRDLSKKTDINQLLSDQTMLIEKLSAAFDRESFLQLKSITFKIKSYILSSQCKSQSTELQASNKDQDNSPKSNVEDIESSLYYSMFNE